jgi:hypothetical protein
MAVYLSHTEINMKKLKPNPKMSVTTSLGLTTGRLRSDNEPIESARPNIKSERDSILGFGIRPLNAQSPRSSPTSRPILANNFLFLVPE